MTPETPRQPGNAGTSLTVGETAAGASASAGFSHALARFLDTLGIADDLPWRPAFEGEECPF